MRAVKRKALLWATEEGGRSELMIIAPRDEKTFRKVFENAVEICAYNPPLNLLSAEESQYRNVIRDNLVRNSFKGYRLIVGHEGARQVCRVYERWKSDLPPIAAGHLARMTVALHPHERDLHTMIDPLGVFGRDLRGVSFFLVDNGTERLTAMLYLLGRPFAEVFVAPEKAIVIECPRNKKDSLYAELKSTFDNRWDRISASGDARYRQGTLCQFCVNYLAAMSRRGKKNAG